MKPTIFSIIIPHYGAPELLERCLCSIPLREDTEVIVVDDCSKEHRCAIKNLVESHGFRFMSTSRNKGGGAARNVGISAAAGRFLIFADSDDTFLPGLDVIMSDHADDDADIIYFRAEGDGIHESNGYNPIPAIRQHLENGDADWLRYSFGEPWCKIVRKSLIDCHGIRFDEIRKHNDTTFAYMIGFHAGSISIDTRPGYCHIVRPGSTTDSAGVGVWLDSVRVFTAKNRFMANHGIPVYDDSAHSYLRKIMAHCGLWIRTRALLIGARYGFLQDTWKQMKEGV